MKIDSPSILKEPLQNRKEPLPPESRSYTAFCSFMSALGFKQPSVIQFSPNLPTYKEPESITFSIFKKTMTWLGYKEPSYQEELWYTKEDCNQFAAEAKKEILAYAKTNKISTAKAIEELYQPQGEL